MVQVDKKITVGNLLSIVGAIVAVIGVIWQFSGELATVKAAVLAQQLRVTDMREDLKRIEQKVDRLVERPPQRNP